MKKIVLLFLVVLLLGAVGTANAVMFEGHDYVVVRFATESWDSATADMLADLGSGYHLATITSQNEQNFIQNTLLASLSGQFWLGGVQSPIAEPVAANNWSWVTGEAWIYMNWAAGEPNDAYGPGSEQHLAMWSNFAWAWNDEGNLSNITGYIAESVPEPAAMLLLGTGFLGLAVLGRKRFLKK